MRENVKNVGLILAIVIAGVSLPTSIVSVMNKSTTPITEVNNYYYNNTITERYNNTVIIDTEDDYSRPLEVFEYTNLTYNEYFADISFNMSADNTVCMFSNETSPSFTLFIVQDSMVSYFYDGHRCWTRSTQVEKG